MSGFTKREHVLPEAFGTFEQNFTLIGVVCDECNQFFGDTLERDFARDTPDGLDRFFRGGKDPSEYKSRGRNSSMTFWFDTGRFQGGQVFQRPVDGIMRVEPLPQVGFSENGLPPIQWFPIAQLPDRETLRSLFESGKRHVQFLNVKDHAAAYAGLRALGAELSEGEAQTPSTDTVRVEWRATLDDRAGRVLTKIGLNYLAHVRGSDFALRSDFDAAREYARYGVAMQMCNWSVDERPLVSGTNEVGHALMLHFFPAGGIVGVRVSFHNSRHYRVGLARGCSLIAQTEAIGHFFSRATGKITTIRPIE